MQGVSTTSRYAARISGIYYQLPLFVGGRRCYQKLFFSERIYSIGFGCDGVYILWNENSSWWQFSSQPVVEAPCIACCKEDELDVTKLSQPWQVQTQGRGDLSADVSLKILKSRTRVSIN